MVALGFASTQAQSEFRQTLDRAAAEGTLKPSVLGVAQVPSRQSRTRVSGRNAPEFDPQARLFNLIVVGVALEIIGGLVMGAAWPATALDPVTGDIESSGSEPAFVAGILITSVGGSLFLVGLIGFAVKYGILAARVSR